MKVILLQDVKSLGKKGAMVEVNEGYARNFIIPKKLGMEATPKNMNDFKLRKAHEEKVAAVYILNRTIEKAQTIAEDMNGHFGRETMTAMRLHDLYPGHFFHCFSH